MRSLIRRALHRTFLRFGFRLVRALPFECSIRRWELDHSDFYMIQVGAHNGVTSDPIQRFIAEGDWTGVLVEPQRKYFQILQAIYCDRPKLHPLHAAIGPSNESIRLYKVRDDAVGVPYWANQLASTKREVIAGHADRIPGLDELIVAEDVPCRTLESIVHEFGLPRLDLLVSDTEGYDFEVIKQIDQLPHRPQFIHFESLHLPPSDLQSCLAFLRERDYATHEIQPGETFAELRAWS